MSVAAKEDCVSSLPVRFALGAACAALRLFRRETMLKVSYATVIAWKTAGIRMRLRRVKGGYIVELR